MKKVREWVKKLVYGHKASSQQYISHLREIGVTVGDDVVVYVPTKTLIDEQYPWMIRIGNHVRIAQGVLVLTHDYAWSTLKIAKKGAILGASGPVNIGNNVFIGMNAIITRGVTIGDNVVIGSGSVVTKDCLPNGVYAGNPARRIAELDEFFEKRQKLQLQEAKKCATMYYEKFGKRPQEEIFHEYFMLFTDVDTALNKSWCVNKMKLLGNYEESVEYLRIHPPCFASFEKFLDYCFQE